MYNALNRIKNSGKNIIVYSDNDISNANYHLVSMADEIYIHEQNSLFLTGFAANFVSGPSNYTSEQNFSENDGLRLIDDPMASIYSTKPSYLSGGGGLVSTLDDYMNFSRMLLNKGSLGDAFILNPETIELTTSLLFAEISVLYSIISSLAASIS